MKILTTITFMLSVFLTSVQTFATTARPVPDYPENANNEVWFIPQFSEFNEINETDMLFLKRTLKRAEKDNIKAVIFEMDTPGGRIDVALKYVSMLARSEVPTIAYLNPQGISAGMIISLAADRVAINPGGVIGDAMPIQMTPSGINPIVDKPEDENPPADKDSAKDNHEEIEDDQDEETTKDKKKADKKPGPLKRILEEIEELKDVREDSKKKRDPELEKIADQKFLTVFFKVLQVLAEKNDRPVKVVRAMADPYQKLSLEEDGYEHTKKSPLTLSANEAFKLNVVDYIAKNKSELLTKLELSDCKLTIIEKSPVEQIIFFLASSGIAGILIALGMVGITIEIRTPGFGIPGIMGVTALTLFFFGQIGIGNSGWGAPIMLFVGIVLLALEIFVIPGFGIVGLLGISCMIISLFMAFGLENIQEASYTISISLLVAFVLIFLLTFYVLPKSTLFNKLVLSTVCETPDLPTSHQDRGDDLMGRIGVAFTDLRPSGLIKIDGKRLDVLTDGEYVCKGEKVTVIDTKGIQLVVEKIDESEEV